MTRARMATPDERSGRSGRLRVLILGLLLVPLVIVLLGALYFEQISSGEEHHRKILRQSVRRIRIPARRGRIFSREMTVLAEDVPDYTLVFYPEEMRQRRLNQSLDYILAAERKVAAAIGRPSGLTRRDVLRHLNRRPGLPIPVFMHLTSREIARALEAMRGLRGVSIHDNPVRRYPQGRLASALIGYTRADDPASASDRGDFFYYLPDQVGRSGVEKAFDVRPGGDEDTVAGLRGKPGYSLVQVDYLGYIHHNIIEHIEPRHGHNVVLTLEARAQRIAESLLKGFRGAMVVLDGDNGDVIAAATAPGFDLREFSPSISNRRYRELQDDPGRPLLNRALQGVYTPGSIVKPLGIIAFMRCGVVPSDAVECTGGVEIGNATIRCAAYRRGGHGTVDMERALAWSCNSFMIANALKMGYAPLFRVFASAGVGVRTGLELPEAAGVAPSFAVKERVFRTRWNRYDTALLSIGQGMVSLTPIQAARYCAALANGGTLWRTHLVEKTVDSGGNVTYLRRPEALGHLDATPEELEVVRKGMAAVVNSAGGSGRWGAVAGLDVCGKTGSAEVGPKNDRRVNTWFIAHVRHRGRLLALAVVVEDGASGGRTCAPLAAEFFRRYLLEVPQENTKKSE